MKLLKEQYCKPELGDAKVKKLVEEVTDGQKDELD